MSKYKYINYIIGVLFGVALTSGCTSYKKKPIKAHEIEKLWFQMEPKILEHIVQQEFQKNNQPTLFNLNDGISLREAEILTLFFNPSLQYTRLQMNIASINKESVQLWEDPDLQIDGEYFKDRSNHRWNFLSQLEITIPLSGRKKVDVKQAKIDLEYKKLAALGAEWSVIRQLRLFWNDWITLHKKKDLLNQAQEEITQLISLIPDFKVAQIATQVDENALHIQLFQIQNDLIELENSIQLKSIQLISLCGLNPLKSWNFETQPVHQTQISSPLKGTNLSKNPEYMLTLLAYDLAEINLELEIKKQIPDLKIGLGTGKDESQSMIQMGLELIPLPLWNANIKNISLAREKRFHQEQKVILKHQDLYYRQTQLALQHKIYSKKYRHLKTQLLPLVQKQIKDAHRLAQLGKLDLYLLKDISHLSKKTMLQLIETKHKLLGVSIQLQSLNHLFHETFQLFPNLNNNTATSR